MADICVAHIELVTRLSPFICPLGLFTTHSRLLAMPDKAGLDFIALGVAAC
jgi:hypothetical protein